LYATPRATLPLAADARAFEVRAAELETALARVLDEAHPPRDVADAIARYLAFYAIWAGQLAPLIAGARKHASEPHMAARGGRPSALEVSLLAAARDELTATDVLARFGALAPAWDVAVATFAEHPELIHDAIARARIAARELEAAQPVDGAIDVVADLAERDDVWFSRAQATVRRALLARGAELGLGDDVFWLPLDEIADGHVVDPDGAHRRAMAARAANARAANWQMPHVVGGSQRALGPLLQGVGSGGRSIGRVVRYASLASAIAVGHGDVVVTRAVTPALAVLVVGCAALVSESGNLLDHGAALARELGITCVVGCQGAWAELGDGTVVLVDGNAGVVSRA
jgi:pyruvate,water dikinase